MAQGKVFQAHVKTNYGLSSPQAVVTLYSCDATPTGGGDKAVLNEETNQYQETKGTATLTISFRFNYHHDLSVKQANVPSLPFLDLMGDDEEKSGLFSFELDSKYQGIYNQAGGAAIDKRLTTTERYIKETLLPSIKLITRD